LKRKLIETISKFNNLIIPKVQNKIVDELKIAKEKAEKESSNGVP
jgi:hypothetical protein